MIKKFIEAQVKVLEEGSFEVIASSGKPDRMGDTIDPKGWYLANYKKNPVILWSHQSGGFGSPATPPVAKADKIWVEDEKELKIKGHFAPTPFAQELRILVEQGFLNAVSVGFLPLIENDKGLFEIEGKTYRRALDEEIEKGIYGDKGEKFIKQELLEVSWVAVPALPQALVSARKMNLSLVTKALEAMEVIEKDITSDASVCVKDLFIKPYPNEHSCRLENPDKYKRFRRKNCEVKHDDKCIDVIYGITKGEEEKAERQALRYDKKIWTEASARSHCKDNDGSFEPASEKEIEIKEGRVLSEKNRTLIKKTVEQIKSTGNQMGQAIAVLEELLEATEPVKGGSPAKDLHSNGRGLLKARKSKRATLLLLNRMNVALDSLLSELKKDKKGDQATLTLVRLADKAIEATLLKLRQKNEKD